MSNYVCSPGESTCMQICMIQLFSSLAYTCLFSQHTVLLFCMLTITVILFYHHLNSIKRWASVRPTENKHPVSKEGLICLQAGSKVLGRK